MDTILVIEKDVKITTGNPGWARKFKVVEKKEKDGFTFWRCEWTEDDPYKSGSPEYEFVGFGVVQHDKSGITAPWVISTWKGKPDDQRGIEERGLIEILLHECPNCKEYVVFKESRKVLGPEAVRVRWTCPECKHVEEDVVD